MGVLIYDGIEIQFEDRVLAHLQVVIGQKLRRRECFFMSWRDSAEVGDGRSAIWLDPAIPLYFKFFGSRPPTINREWIEKLAMSANSAHGLVVLSELDEDVVGNGHHNG
ncbi:MULTISPECIES: ATP-dependent DNA ligase [unclassified Salinibacterium]|uniref:DUF7882 family protein n=1 Tax=unclassified Salinibacterium TaxID=2632331 RepID=UPI0014240DFE|nr:MULTISPECIES: ATP-dependent DNA ligase [unclassified Salinibacterium]